MIDFKGHRFEKDVILTSVRWYLFYPLSYRHLKEMLAERGVDVDHSSVYLWVQKFTPQLEAAFRKAHKRRVGGSWRMDETTIKIQGQWKYLYRAVDKAGQDIDFLLTAHRDKKAALRVFKKAIRQHGYPDTITIDKSSANTVALETLNADPDVEITIRQSKYLNNRVEQDHRAFKRIVKLMLGFKPLHSARRTLRGIELMHMIKKGQMVNEQCLAAAEPFYSLATQLHLMAAHSRLPETNATEPFMLVFFIFGLRRTILWLIKSSREEKTSSKILLATILCRCPCLCVL